MRNCPAVAKNIEDNLLLKNDFLRYSGYIFQVRLTKAKLLSSIFCAICCTKNYSNRFIFDSVV